MTLTAFLALPDAPAISRQVLLRVCRRALVEGATWCEMRADGPHLYYVILDAEAARAAIAARPGSGNPKINQLRAATLAQQRAERLAEETQ